MTCWSLQACALCRYTANECTWKQPNKQKLKRPTRAYSLPAEREDNRGEGFRKFSHSLFLHFRQHLHLRICITLEKLNQKPYKPNESWRGKFLKKLWSCFCGGEGRGYFENLQKGGGEGKGFLLSNSNKSYPVPSFSSVKKEIFFHNIERSLTMKSVAIHELIVDKWRQIFFCGYFLYPFKVLQRFWKSIHRTYSSSNGICSHRYFTRQ